MKLQQISKANACFALHIIGFWFIDLSTLPLSFVTLLSLLRYCVASLADGTLSGALECSCSDGASGLILKSAIIKECRHQC